MNVAYILLAMLVLMVVLLAWDGDWGDVEDDARATVSWPEPPEPDANPDRWHRAGAPLEKAGLLLLGLVIAASIEIVPYLIIDAILGDGDSTTTCVDLSAFSDADRAALEAAPARLSTASGIIELDDLIRPCDP